jgi:hypothetical protein
MTAEVWALEHHFDFQIKYEIPHLLLFTFMKRIHIQQTLIIPLWPKAVCSVISNVLQLNLSAGPYPPSSYLALLSFLANEIPPSPRHFLPKQIFRDHAKKRQNVVFIGVGVTHIIPLHFPPVSANGGLVPPHPAPALPPYHHHQENPPIFQLSTGFHNSEAMFFFMEERADVPPGRIFSIAAAASQGRGELRLSVGGLDLMDPKWVPVLSSGGYQLHKRKIGLRLYQLSKTDIAILSAT